MKVFLEIDEIKTIRDALYLSVAKIKQELEKKELPVIVIDAADESIARKEKIISYFNELIRKEEV